MRIAFLTQSPERPHERESNPQTEALLNSYASPGTTVELVHPDDFPGAAVLDKLMAQMAANGLHHAMEVPALVRKAVWLEQNGYDAIIQSNTFDPGVEACRLAVRIPVIGVLRASLHVGATLADNVGITVPFDTHVPHTWRLVRAYGMERFVAGIRPIRMYVENLAQRSGELRERSLEVMRSLIQESDAHCILPLGGLLIPYAVKPEDLERELGVPVLNTKAIGIRVAEMCVRFGMAHSVRSYPPARLRSEDFTATAAAADSPPAAPSP